jgi:hypothetical protein
MDDKKLRKKYKFFQWFTVLFLPNINFLFIVMQVFYARLMLLESLIVKDGLEGYNFVTCQ